MLQHKLASAIELCMRSPCKRLRELHAADMLATRLKLLVRPRQSRYQWYPPVGAWYGLGPLRAKAPFKAAGR